MEYVDIEDCKTELSLLDNSEISLNKLLNYCKTASGGKVLNSWISKPLKSPNSINERLDLVEFFGLDSCLRMELFSKLKRLPDVNPLISRFSSIDSGKRGAKLEDCVKLYHYSQTIFDIIQIIQPNPYFSSLFMQHEENSTKIIELVNKSIDMTSKSLENDYKIKPEFDPTLIP